MSDDVSIYGETDREYHSAFDIGLDPTAQEVIKWLILGHLCYLGGLAFTLLAAIDMGNVWATPLFVLPLLWAERSQFEWKRALVLVGGFTAMHAAAVYLATQSYEGTAARALTLEPGVIGGAVGAFGALALCAVLRMLRPGLPTLIFAAFGGLLLAGAGGVGVYMYLGMGGGGDGFAATFKSLLWVYVPWQLLFAYVLAKTLKPAGD
jgi:hypothetical protein